MFGPDPATHGLAVRLSDAEALTLTESPPNCAAIPESALCNGKCLAEGETTASFRGADATHCDRLPGTVYSDGGLYFYDDQQIRRFELASGGQVLAALDPIGNGWVPLACHPDAIVAFTVSNDVVYFVTRRGDEPAVQVFRAERESAALIVDSASVADARWFPKLRVAGDTLALTFLDEQLAPGRYLKIAARPPVRGPQGNWDTGSANYGGYEYFSDHRGIWRIAADDLDGAGEELPVDGDLVGFYAGQVYIEPFIQNGLDRVDLQSLHSTHLAMTGRPSGVFNGRVVSTIAAIPAAGEHVFVHALVDLDTGNARPLGHTQWEYGFSPKVYATNQSAYAFYASGRPFPDFRLTIPTAE